MAVATLFTLVMTTRNHLLWQEGPHQTSWLWHLRREIPLWFPWLLFLPLLLHLSRRFPFERGRFFHSLLVHALAAPAITVVIVTIALCGQYALDRELTPGPGPFSQVAQRYLISLPPLIVTNYVWIVALHQALLQARAARQLAAERIRLQGLLSDARLANLHNQLQPHFFFNALHGISSLMSHDVSGARRMIATVSELLRLSLDRDSREEVTVEEELELVERYLALQKMRFEDGLTVEIDVAPQTRTALLPSFLLQTLVENAVRHGIEKRRAGGRLEVAVRRDHAGLVVRVRDNGPGPRAEPKPAGGLTNLQKRLRCLYGDSGRFTLQELAEGGASAEVKLPFRLAMAAVPAQERPGQKTPTAARG
jgi:two-component system LytT family sensor kinase